MYSLACFGNTPPRRFTNKRLDWNLLLSKLGPIKWDRNQGTVKLTCSRSKRKA